jgi:hypothetical protein
VKPVSATSNRIKPTMKPVPAISNRIKPIRKSVSANSNKVKLTVKNVIAYHYLFTRPATSFLSFLLAFTQLRFVWKKKFTK